MTTQQDPSDSDLLKRVAAKDMRAMEVIYRRHGSAVSAFIGRYVRDPAEVADILHNAMLDVWRNAHKFEGRAQPRTWIMTLARNKAVDHIRKQARVTPVEPTSETLEEIDTQNAEKIVAAAQDRARLRACVDKLPAAQKSVVHLAFFEELPYGEVAEVEGIPVGTVKTRIFNAKKLLMHCLQRGGKKV